MTYSQREKNERHLFFRLLLSQSKILESFIDRGQIPSRIEVARDFGRWLKNPGEGSNPRHHQRINNEIIGIQIIGIQIIGARRTPGKLVVAHSTLLTALYNLNKVREGISICLNNM